MGQEKPSVKYVLQNREGLKVAVIVSDMSELNVDAALVQNENILSRTEEKLVEMTTDASVVPREDLMIKVKN